MKILLTGATGLIGTEVMKTLAAAGHQVTATDRKGGDIPAGVNFILGELTDDKFILHLKESEFRFNNRFEDLSSKILELI